MREAIGGTWIFGIVVFFIVLFSAYLALSVNYSKAFKVKDGIINIIERNKGYNLNAQSEISLYLNDIGYFASGDCASEASKGDNVVGGRARYCVKKDVDSSDKSAMPKTVYTVTVFFRLDVPIFWKFFTFPVYGQTKTLINTGE